MPFFKRFLGDNEFAALRNMPMVVGMVPCRFVFTLLSIIISYGPPTICMYTIIICTFKTYIHNVRINVIQFICVERVFANNVLVWVDDLLHDDLQSVGFGLGVTCLVFC